MILYLTTSITENATPLSKKVSREIYVYGQSAATESRERYWPAVASLAQLTDTDKPGESAVIPLQMSRVEAEIAAPKQTQDVIEGIVEDVEGDDARVKLHYGDRDNTFIFSASELNAVGAAYAGALFGISVEPDYSYKLVHLKEREQARRAQAPPPDLAFLEE